MADIQTKIIICQSKVESDEKILFRKITHHPDPEIKLMLVRGLFGDGNSTFHFGPLFTCY